MMEGLLSELVIGVLGIANNEPTAGLLDYLTLSAGLRLDFVVYWTPSLRQQWRRLRRKVKAEGILPAIERGVYAMRHWSEDRTPNSPRTGRSHREYFVPGHNSEECRFILNKEKVDVLILATDAIIGPRVLRIPRIVTLNAHPGWIPKYRGLGANLFQMENGELPAVSVHAVDEGIDTGPLIAREKINLDPRQGLRMIEAEVDRKRYEMLAEVVSRLREGSLPFIDTFCERSSVTRGMPRSRRKRLDALLKSGELNLC